MTYEKSSRTNGPADFRMGKLPVAGDIDNGKSAGHAASGNTLIAQTCVVDFIDSPEDSYHFSEQNRQHAWQSVTLLKGVTLTLSRHAARM